MTQGLAHRLPEEGAVYRRVSEAEAAPSAEAPPADPTAALLDRRDKIALTLVLLSGGAFYAALFAWIF